MMAGVNKMSADPTQVAMIQASVFPVLHLKPPAKIADLLTFAEETLAMIISRKALHKMKRLLKPYSDQLLLCTRYVSEFSGRQGC